MAATPLSWLARIVDVQTDITIAETTEVINPEIVKTIDASGSARATFRTASVFLDAIVECWGGSNYQGDNKPYILYLYQDGGTVPETALWIESGSINFGGPDTGITIDGKDIADGFDRSYIDKQTFIDCYIEDVLGAPPGGIRVDPASSVLSGNTLPSWWEGMYYHAPGRNEFVGAYHFLFSAVVAPGLTGNKVDTDINTDSIFRATGNVVASASGVLDIAHPELFGANQHFTYDVPNRKVYCGYRGDTPVLTLRGDVSPYYANELVEAAIVDGDTNKFTPDLTSKFAQVQFIGGSSTHGMPAGGTFTGAVMINQPTDGNSTGAYDNLIIVSITTGENGMGGVFTWLGDGTLRPFSQSMDVNCLIYDRNTSILYAGTKRGVFSRDMSRGGYGKATWGRLGGNDSQQALYEYTKVWSPGSGVIYAVASGTRNGTGVNGVYRYESDAWTRAITCNTLVDASGTDDELYYVSSTAPGAILKTAYPSTGHVTAVTGKGDEHIVGLDFDPFTTHTIVRTEIGSLGFYYLASGSCVTVDSTSSLRDRYGSLEVSEFLGYNNTINTVHVNGFVLTDRGVYWRKGVAGPFLPTDGQNGIQNVNGTYLAVGTAQTIMGRTFVPAVVVSGSSFYLSRDGGSHFQDEMAQPLDALSAWYEAIKQFTGDYPTGTTAAFGPVFATDPQGHGEVVRVPVGNALTLPDGWLCARRWTANGTFVVRLFNAQSNAPYNALKPAELVEIQANDTRSVLDGSSAVLTGAYRFLAQANRPMFSLSLTTTYSTQEAALRTLKCGDLLKVSYYVAYTNTTGSHTTVLCDLENTVMNVINIHGYLGPSGEWLVDLTLVNPAAFSLLDLTKIVAAVANGQAKDRRKAGVRIR